MCDSQVGLTYDRCELASQPINLWQRIEELHPIMSLTLVRTCNTLKGPKTQHPCGHKVISISLAPTFRIKSIQQ